jgi:hypothetical protein
MIIDWRYELEKLDEKFWLWLARHLPRKLAYWSYIVQGGRAMRGDDVVPEVRYAELLERMEK